MRDGWLLLKLRLQPAAVVVVGGGGEGGRGGEASGDGREQRGSRRALVSSSATTIMEVKSSTRGDAVRRFSSITEPAYRRLMLWWLVLGGPLSAHRWKLHHRCHAAFHCTLNAIAATLITVGRVGTMHRCARGWCAGWRTGSMRKARLGGGTRMARTPRHTPATPATPSVSLTP